MNFLDLCAGIGGFSLGLEWTGMTCAGQVEIDDYCNKVLEKHWPGVPRWRDIKTVNPADLPAVELICGGYPCQPFSQAGLRRGQEDDRHIWPYILPIVAEIRPSWCLFENVAGHITLGLDQVLADLEDIGYSARPIVVPACAVDAPHRRDRVWILADAEMCERNESLIAETGKYQGERPRTVGRCGGFDDADTQSDGRRSRRPLPDSERAPLLDYGLCGDVPDADDRRGIMRGHGEFPTVAPPERGGSNHRGRTPEHEPGQRRPTKPRMGGMVDGFPSALDGTRWRPEPNIPRVTRGVPNRVSRLKALGNAVVPQVVAEIGRAIMDAETKER